MADATYFAREVELKKKANKVKNKRGEKEVFRNLKDLMTWNIAITTTCKCLEKQ